MTDRFEPKRSKDGEIESEASKNEVKQKVRRPRTRSLEGEGVLDLVGNQMDAEKYAGRGRKDEGEGNGAVKRSRIARLENVADATRPPPTAHRPKPPAPRTTRPTKVSLRHGAKLPRGDWAGFNSALPQVRTPQLRTNHLVRPVSDVRPHCVIGRSGRQDGVGRDSAVVELEGSESGTGARAGARRTQRGDGGWGSAHASHGRG